MSGAEHFAADPASAIDDLAAIFGLHPLAESEGALALDFAGLVGAFHLLSSSSHVVLKG